MNRVAKSIGVRTPEQLAKAEMKTKALAEMQGAGYSTQAEVVIRYMGTEYSLPADPTVNVKSGQVILHFGTSKKLQFGSDLFFGVGGNIMTGLEITGWQPIATKYGLTEDDVDLDEGETTR
jgi:hypothetical protein